MFQRGLICTDLSDGLHRFKDFVPHLAKSGLKQIIFANSVELWKGGSIPREDYEKIEQVNNFFADTLKENYEEIEVKIEVVSGRPVDTIPKLINQYESDIIFMGTPLQSILEEKIFGSTSMAVAKSTKNPLMILRPQLISTYTCEELALRCEHLWRYLLIPYNAKEPGYYLIERICQSFAKNPNNTLEKCLLCWVIDEGGGSKDISKYHREEAEEKLEKAKQKLERV